MASSKVAVTVLPTATPTAPSSGVLDSTLGGVTSVESHAVESRREPLCPRAIAEQVEARVRADRGTLTGELTGGMTGPGPELKIFSVILSAAKNLSFKAAEIRNEAALRSE